ncbi:hypothetical protein [Baaleninema sp.]|uniref:hypothetical protein n=1 Tax=Baaleninema sp. TaxID=3101197 RepID=UPI003D015EF1
MQFWRRYLKSIESPINAFLQFNTVDLFEYETDGRSLPQQFFDFIVISHCFFADPQLRSQSNRIYRQIFQRHLKPGGWVLLVVQWTKLYKVYEIERDENVGQEREVIQKFVEEELGLNLQWYRYVTSTGQRTWLKNFREFADRYCPPHTQLDDLYQTYLKLNYRPHYAIDDYIILARSTPQT